jgi:hypothetical protein
MLAYALATVLSAFLLFQVQPIIAKIILPWFGGSAAVWTVCLLFFQVVLVLGYLYAHAIVTYLRPRMQVTVHLALLLLSALALPIYPSVRAQAGAGDPTWAILGLLAVTVGPPYFLLSTTGPLLQAWYARQRKGTLPYWLYALSNAGSMVALLSYPVLFEPAYTLHRQAEIWSISYGAFVLMCGIAAWRSRKASDEFVEQTAGVRPGPREYVMWLLLPACASVLLLATTSYLSQNVAPIPLLWVLPLSIYLLSFILSFAGGRWYRRVPFLFLLPVALGAMAYAIKASGVTTTPLRLLIVLFSLGLFVCCMVCHGELARLKPHPRYLTHFYLMISCGGAMGGIFVGLVSPHLFRMLYEMPLALVGCAVLVLFALWWDPQLTPWFRGWRALAPATGAVLTVALFLFLANEFTQQARGSFLRVRNFYGALRVRDADRPEFQTVRALLHGTIVHGEQFTNPLRRTWPTTYFAPHSGVGLAIREKQTAGSIRVGVIGLGAGTIAAYGRAGDSYRFYEINPLVPVIARSMFSFLRDSQAHVEIVMGDARVSLEKEAPENFDVLAVDAFSGDAIPVHLLTREAVQLYFHHLKPNGILAVHVSNNYLDLESVVGLEALIAGKMARAVVSAGNVPRDALAAVWVLVTSPATGFGEDIMNRSVDPQPAWDLRLWTDDYSNVFQILK